MKYQDLTDRLASHVATMHEGCDDCSCDISAALYAGYDLWAIELYSNAVDDEEFARLYAKLPRERFASDAEASRAAMCASIPTKTCPDCNAVTWCEPGLVGYTFDQCDSCLGSLEGIEAETLKASDA